ncbi:MAG: glycosyltransferase [Desulfuromonadales bacterium]|nr:glycosyltransferase [Desulfuromonadales bacterium]
MKKIRMLKASSFYSRFLDSLYGNDPELANRSYAEQYATIFGASFAWADFWKLNLESSGLYEVMETVINAEHLQKSWAREHNAAWSDQSWRLDILKAQIAEFQPDIFFSHDFDIITPEFRAEIKLKFPCVRLIVGWNGIALHDAAKFANIDLLLTGLDDTVRFFQSHGIEAMEVRFGFETSIIDKIGEVGHYCPVSFVGGISLMQGGHYRRLKLLSAVSKQTSLELWLSGSSFPEVIKGGLKYLKRRDLHAFAAHLQALPRYGRLLAKSRGEAFGLDMYRILASSRITLNSHIDAAGGKAGNIRLFEATGAGACLVTDWKENLEDMFKLEEEVVTYRTPEEAAEKIAYLLEHENERCRIATAGQARTLRDHTFKRMVDEADARFQTLLA